MWVEMRICTDVRYFLAHAAPRCCCGAAVLLTTGQENLRRFSPSAQGELLYIVQRDITHIRAEVRANIICAACRGGQQFFPVGSF